MKVSITRSYRTLPTLSFRSTSMFFSKTARSSTENWFGWVMRTCSDGSRICLTGNDYWNFSGRH